jgi:hypothetical protein
MTFQMAITGARAGVMASRGKPRNMREHSDPNTWMNCSAGGHWDNNRVLASALLVLLTVFGKLKLHPCQLLC